MWTVCVYNYAGEADNMVKFEYGKLSADFLKSINCPKHDFKSYPNLGHSSDDPVSSSVAKLRILLLRTIKFCN